MGLRFPRWLAVVVTILVAVPGFALSGSAAPSSAGSSTSPFPIPRSPVVSPALSPAGAESPMRTIAPAYQPAPGTRVVGALPPTSPLDVVVGLPPSNPSGLASYLAAESVPGSSTSRSFLSPMEVADRYGPEPSVVNTVRQYFSGYGLNSSSLPGGFLLDLEGSSAAVGEAFGTTFEEYRTSSGRLFVSHPTAATLPSGLAVTGAYGLGDAVPFEPFARSVGPMPLASAPFATCIPGPTGVLSPCEVQTAYSSSALIAGGANGSGERIGIVDAYDGSEAQSQLASDFALFTSQFGLPSGQVSYAYPVPTSGTDLNNSSLNTAWGLEEALDLEWTRASAPGAGIVMAFSPDPGPGLLYAVDWLVATHAVDVISMSWGEPLTGVFNAFSQPCLSACNASTDGTYTILDPVFEAAAAEGISLFAATGECGAGAGTSGFAVNYPAADPFVTAVGGTVLRTASDGTYLGESAWNGTVSGAVSPGCTNQGGSGGGYSGLPRPWWQLGLPNASGGRAIPDVAIDAATPATIAYEGSFGGALGTSLGTPIWAGVAAIADDKAGHTLGLLNPGLYDLYRGSSYSLDFHDILLGNNGYPAGPGWDPVTGVGTPIVDNLVADLIGSSPLPAHRPTTFVYASPRYGRAPLNVSFVVNASGGTGSFPVAGVDFGDGNSSLNGNVTSHEYLSPGVYAARGLAIDSGGNASASPPVAIVVGGGQALSVQLSASSQAPATGAAVDFTMGASGGLAPYSFDVFFGDGTFLDNRTGSSVTHAFDAAGSYCAEVVAHDAASPVDGGASSRVAIAVGGAPAPDCGNDSIPITLTPNPAPEIRDAPAEFPSLFTSTGGVRAPAGLANSFQYWANDAYVRACQCDIFRTPGNYSVEVWENDTVNTGASARTNVTVTPELVGDFTASTLSGPAPLTVAFSVSVTGGYRADPASTRWSFTWNCTGSGCDGTSSTGASVSYTFDTPGEYLAVGQLSDAGHGNASEAFVIDVEGSGASASLGLTATIAPAVEVDSGTTVEFSSQMIGPKSPAGIEVGWDTGAGRSAYGAEVNQTFYAPLPPTATALGGVGLTDTLPVVLFAVNASWAVVAQASFDLPSFFAVETGGFVPRSSALSFNASLSAVGGPAPLTTVGRVEVRAPGNVTTEWIFGDGSNATGPVADHTYVASGLFGARVEVGDSLGDRAVGAFGVNVNTPLTVSGGPSVSSGTAPLNVTFRAFAFGGYGPPYSFSWTFSSGSPANGSVVNRTFASAGTYTATVHVRAAQGPSVNRSWTVTVARSGGLPAELLIVGAGAIGAAVGLLALGVIRRSRRASRETQP